MSDDLRDWRDWCSSREVVDDLRRSNEAVRDWERAHPSSLADLLRWIEQLRLLFGDPPVDPRPWRGESFRL